MKDKTPMQQAIGARRRSDDDSLGPNSDIGVKLRAFYGAVQDEGIPDKLLDLLEQLDAVEKSSSSSSAKE